MHFYCERCKKEYPVATHAYACECGGLFRLYQSAMDAEDRHEAVTLGETETPLLPLVIDGAIWMTGKMLERMTAPHSVK